MRNFDTELDTAGVVRRVVAPVVTLTVSRSSDAVAVPAPAIMPRSDLLSSAQGWTWEQLRDYVVAQVLELHGPFPRDAVKEAAIFRSFVSRWGEQAGPIAVAAFTAHGGYWRSAPIGVNRFSKGSDPYFAVIIAANI